MKRKLTKLNTRRTDVGTEESWVLYHIMRFSSSPNEKLLVWPTISEICQRKAAPTQGQCRLSVFLMLILISFCKKFLWFKYDKPLTMGEKSLFFQIIIVNVGLVSSFEPTKRTLEPLWRSTLYLYSVLTSLFLVITQ